MLFVFNILIVTLINSGHFTVYNVFKLKQCKTWLLTLAWGWVRHAKRVETYVGTQEILLYLTVIDSHLPTYDLVTENSYRLSDTMECNTGVFLVRDAPELRGLGEFENVWRTDCSAQTIGPRGGVGGVGSENNRNPQPIVVHVFSGQTRISSVVFVLEHNGRRNGVWPGRRTQCRCLHKNWGSHDNYDCGFLGCDAVITRYALTPRKNVLPPFSGQKVQTARHHLPLAPQFSR
jgi:hypothetical protein